MISVCALAGSLIGVVAMAEYGFYERSRESVFEEVVTVSAVDEWVDLYNYGYSGTENGVNLYESRSNLIFTVRNEDGTIIAKTAGSDNAAKESYSFTVGIELFRHQGEDPEWRLASINRDYRYQSDKVYRLYMFREDGYDWNEQTLTIEFKEGMPVNDTYRLQEKVINAAYDLRTWIFPIGFGFGVLAVASFVGLMSVSGRRREDEEVHPGPLTVIPFDVMLAAAFFAAMLYIVGMTEVYYSSRLELALAAVGIPVFLAMGLGVCMSFAARMKARILVSGLLITKILKFCWKLIKMCGSGIKKLVLALPLSWKAVIVVGVDFFVNLFLIVMAHWRATDGAIVLLIMKSFVVLCGAVYITMKVKKLQEGARELAEGNLYYKIDTTGMLPKFREHAETLNSISDGMSVAVEQRMKSERMKTELITNVSHDIKTPLTSIINYVGLIANEECDNDKHAEYTEVLKRQSEKLKRLIEDLVEASKASTGNLEVHPAICDASVLLTQVSGEFEERLREAGLTPVIKQTEEQLNIMADGRHMWRIFDNLMGNICKYSLPGSRVYLTLERDGNMAQFLFKNTSKEVLDISEEELMERFVRGDSSRNTEGNGLGLSIAKSLAQIQGGTLRIETDGDLFKAIVRFPLVENRIAAVSNDTAMSADGDAGLVQ